MKTYKYFEKYGVLIPEKMLNTSWEGLVEILDEGSYARYDYKTADKLLEAMINRNTKYGRSISLPNEKAADSLDLERRLKELGKRHRRRNG